MEEGQNPQLVGFPKHFLVVSNERPVYSSWESVSTNWRSEWDSLLRNILGPVHFRYPSVTWRKNCCNRNEGGRGDRKKKETRKQGTYQEGPGGERPLESRACIMPSMPPAPVSNYVTYPHSQPSLRKHAQQRPIHPTPHTHTLQPLGV